MLEILLAASLVGQGFSPEDAVRRMKVAEGFSVQLFAHEPEVRQPVAIQFDERGRLWVVQYLQYPNPAGLKVLEVDRYLRTKYDRLPDPPPKGPRGADRITICEDTDGDGRADRFKDFVTGLNLATGLAFDKDGVYVLQSPYLLYYPDRNHDDIPDGDPEVLLSGFGMDDAHAFANSLNWGPDGWLYGAQGSTVTANIRGIQFQQGIWRYHPRTKAFELFSEGGGNTWGADFDAHGNMIAGTNWGGYAMLHQVQGGYYIKGFEKHGPLQNPYAFGYFDHVPYKDFQGGHVTCGGILYDGGSFPVAFHGKYIAANILSNAIHWHHLEPNGSTFKASFGGELLQANDTWFRPIDCTVGPDGALYVADWYDRRANHVDPKDDWDRTNGRIYRFQAKDAKPLGFPKDLSKLKTEDLIPLLDVNSTWHRREARRLIEQRDEARFGPVFRTMVAKEGNTRMAREALWAAYGIGAFDEAWARERMDHPSADVRTWIVRFLGDAGKIEEATRNALVDLAAREPSPVVRCQLACSSKRLPAADALPILRPLMARDEDRNDPFLPLLIWWALESKVASAQDEVLSLFDSAEAWKGTLVRTSLVERLARRLAAEGTDRGYAGCARLLQKAPDAESKSLVLVGMEKGLEGRKLERTPAPLVEPMATVMGQGAPAAVDLRLALRLAVPGAEEVICQRVEDSKAPVPLRVSLIDVLGQLGTLRCAPLLQTCLQEGTPTAVRKAALLALARFPQETIPESVIQVFPKLTPDLKVAARSLLTARATAALALLRAVDSGRITTKDLTDEDLRKIALFEDPRIVELVEKHWGKVQKPSSGETLARIHGIAVTLRMAKGDPTRGKEIFTKTCGVCHKLHGEGNSVGPDLTGLDRNDVFFLLSNIVDPSAVIRKEYVSYIVEVEDGRILTGLLAESSPASVTILDAKNQRTVISRSDVVTMRPSKQSLMPEKLLDPLDHQQLRDLFSYLQGGTPDVAKPAAAVLPSPPAVAVSQETYKQVGDVELKMTIYRPEVPSSTEGKGTPVERRPAIVFFFGGGWRQGSVKQFEPQSRYLAARGLVALTADYRVESRHGTKAIHCVADAKSAIRWTRRNAARLGIDPNRLVAAGGSAGGHLAAATALVPNFDEPGEDTKTSCVPNALVLFNPALVLTKFGSIDLPKLTRPDLLAEFTARLGTEPIKVSPAHHLHAGLPPTLILHGQVDRVVPVKTVEAFRRRAKELNCRCELVTYPGQDHGFFNLRKGDAKYFRETLIRTDKFLASLGYIDGPPVEGYLGNLRP